LRSKSATIERVQIYGPVVGVRGLMVEVAGPPMPCPSARDWNIETGPGRAIACEIVSFSGGHALAMPFAALDVCGAGAVAVVSTAGQRASGGRLAGS
jgi:flagellum-specific ATP synthase